MGKEDLEKEVDYNRFFYDKYNYGSPIDGWIENNGGENIIFGFRFKISVEGNQLEVRIRGDSAELEKIIRKIESGKMFSSEEMAQMANQRKKYAEFLVNPRFERGENGEYYFRAELKTDDSEKRLYAIVSFAMRPIFLHDYLKAMRRISENH